MSGNLGQLPGDAVMSSKDAVAARNGSFACYLESMSPGFLCVRWGNFLKTVQGSFE